MRQCIAKDNKLQRLIPVGVFPPGIVDCSAFDLRARKWNELIDQRARPSASLCPFTLKTFSSFVYLYKSD